MYDPERSLIEQSRSHSPHAPVPNGDGVGLGWYGRRDVPAVFRSAAPAWGDANLHELSCEISEPLQMTVGNTLHYSEDVDVLRLLYPVNEPFGHFSAESRAVVSEPLVPLPGLWHEVEAGSAVTVEEGKVNRVAFTPGSRHDESGGSLRPENCHVPRPHREGVADLPSGLCGTTLGEVSEESIALDLDDTGVARTLPRPVHQQDEVQQVPYRPVRFCDDDLPRALERSATWLRSAQEWLGEPLDVIAVHLDYDDRAGRPYYEVKLLCNEEDLAGAPIAVRARKAQTAG